MRVLNVLCFAALFCCGVCRGADTTVYTTTTNGVTWTWTLSNGGAVLGGDGTSSNGTAVPKETAGDLVVPETIEGHQVVGLNRYAFYGCKAVQSISIPDGVTSMGESTFAYCTTLNHVALGSGIKVIPSNTFSGCTGLRSFEIPSHITSLGSSVFSGCSALTNVVIGSGITEIPSYAFQNCSSL